MQKMPIVVSITSLPIMREKMKVPSDIKVYGDMEFRGKCPSETLEQVTFFARLRRLHPKYGAVALHPRNEGKRTHLQAAKEKSEGMTTGATDIIIPSNPSFVCELKRRDHTVSTLGQAQVTYMRAAQDTGCFVCLALGADAAWQAFEEWLDAKAE
jgi:hypothetical protein